MTVCLFCSLLFTLVEFQAWLSLFFNEKIQRKNAQDALKIFRKERKTSVRERFGLFTLEFTEFVKGFVEAGRKKTY